LSTSELTSSCVSAALGCCVCCHAVRDRLFEAGFDDDVSVSWLGQAVQMPTSEYSQYLAVAVVAGLGVAGGWGVAWWRWGGEGRVDGNSRSTRIGWSTWSEIKWLWDMR
jgi:hypothetical protein